MIGEPSIVMSTSPPQLRSIRARPIDGISAMPPFLMRPGFHPDGVYRINVDSDGDAQADAAFTFTFSELRDGAQTASVHYATGTQARQPGPTGELLISATPVGFDAAAQPVQAGPGRLFAGIRSDPFFADADGAFHGFQWTGQDAFANRNIAAIVLEVPNDLLGADPAIGLWATVSVRRDGALVPVDRGGHPTINPFINPDGEKNLYNSRQPADDLANYLQPWTKLLEGNGYPPEEAAAAVRIVLPDILRYDRGRPASYPNGRARLRYGGAIDAPGSRCPLPRLREDGAVVQGRCDRSVSRR